MSKIEEALQKVKSDEHPHSKSDDDFVQSDYPDSEEHYNLDEITLEEFKIIYPEMQDQDVLDAFRELRISTLKKIDRVNSLILVVSAEDDGDSSYVAMNLAVAIAMDESKNSLFIDCNLKSETDYSSLTGNSMTLASYLEKSSLEIEDVIQKVGIPRLRIIASGNEKSLKSEYFTKDRMRHLLLEVKKRYKDRAVIINAPSINHIADVRILDEMVDYVIVTIPSGKVSWEDVHDATKSLSQEKILGVTLFDVPRLPLNIK